jgi:hypothetical protein
MIAAVLGIIRARVPQDRRAWFETTLARSDLHGDELIRALALVPRKIGTALIETTEAERVALVASRVEWLAAGAAVDEVGRVALVGRAAELASVDAPAVVAECYRQGDAREKRAVLRALPLLPVPARFVETAINACRTNVQTVFDAIACENPYPADHFPDPSFNQMVLKCLFVGVALSRVVGLGGRLSPELARMAAGYASERRAAGRTVPADIDRILGEGVSQ